MRDAIQYAALDGATAARQMAVGQYYYTAEELAADYYGEDEILERQAFIAAFRGHLFHPVVLDDHGRIISLGQ